MEDQLQTILKQARSLTPSADFLIRSKATIVTTPQRSAGFLFIRSHLFEGARFTTALTLAALLLFIFVGSFSYMNNSHTSSLASSNALLDEARSLTFQLQIKEASYFDQTAEQVAVALDEIAGARKSQIPSPQAAP